jgi:hypothetical protein
LKRASQTPRVRGDRQRAAQAFRQRAPGPSLSTASAGPKPLNPLRGEISRNPLQILRVPDGGQRPLEPTLPPDNSSDYVHSVTPSRRESPDNSGRWPYPLGGIIPQASVLGAGVRGPGHIESGADAAAACLAQVGSESVLARLGKVNLSGS